VATQTPVAPDAGQSRPRRSMSEISWLTSVRS
jgi:hypothetical protein